MRVRVNTQLSTALTVHIMKTRSMGGNGHSLLTTMKNVQTLRKIVVSVRMIEPSESVTNAVMQDAPTFPRKEESVGGMVKRRG
mmetsp:Transcript_26370/g.47566  ORF Transcript_26370/g.47566 Transcript_26370/m.47566 type:complete len:83 (-) Transcript_26370:144-392(-)